MKTSLGGSAMAIACGLTFSAETACAQSDWFTCSAGTTCVEYKIDDAAEKKRFMAQCRNLSIGRSCPNRIGCVQRAPGRVAITYDSQISNEGFASICTSNHGQVYTP